MEEKAIGRMGYVVYTQEDYKNMVNTVGVDFAESRVSMFDWDFRGQYQEALEEVRLEVQMLRMMEEQLEKLEKEEKNETLTR